MTAVKKRERMGSIAFLNECLGILITLSEIMSVLGEKNKKEKIQLK